METGIYLTIASVFALLIAIYRESTIGICITKPLASLGFLITAVYAGALNTNYGTAVLAALVLSWWGDVLLIPKSKKIFLLGILSFLLGHVGFIVSFAIRGIYFDWALYAASVVLPLAFIIAKWLLKHVDGKMKIAVIAYILVIATMVIAAFGAYPSDQLYLLPLAAIMFFVSDLAVARHRFVKASFLNKLWGLPLYYGAQLLFAYSVSVLH